MANKMINALLQKQAMDQQGASNLGSALSGLGQSAEKLAGVSKVQKFKNAGQKLIELGGPTEKNLKLVVRMFDLTPEETRELIVTCQTMLTFNKQKRISRPLDDQTRQLLSEKIGFPLKEGATLKDVVSIAGAIPQGKVWGSKFLESETGPGQFVSDEPGTDIPEGYATPESIRAKKALEQKKITDENTRVSAAKKLQAGEDKVLTAKQEKQKTVLMASLEKAISSYERAVLGINQFMPNENNIKIVQQEQERIKILAEQYAAVGGTLEDLGVKTIEIFKKWFSGEEALKETPGESGSIGGFFKGLFGKDKQPAPVPQKTKQPIYVNPETGQRIMWDGTRWTPVTE
jgi:hypothetical protein